MHSISMVARQHWLWQFYTKQDERISVDIVSRLLFQSLKRGTTSAAQVSDSLRPAIARIQSQLHLHSFAVFTDVQLISVLDIAGSSSTYILRMQLTTVLHRICKI